MDKFSLCLVLLAIIVGIKAQAEDAFPNYWDDDYEDNWSNEELEALGIVEPEKNAYEDTNAQEKNQKEIDEFRDTGAKDADYDAVFDFPDTAPLGNQQKNEQDMDNKIEKEIQELRGDKDTSDGVSDYQFEDNRFEIKDEQQADDGKKENVDGDIDSNNFAAVADMIDLDSARVNNNPEDTNDDDMQPLPLPHLEDSENKAIFDETRAIVNNDAEENIVLDKGDLVNNQPDSDIVEETNRLLAELDNVLDENVNPPDANVNINDVQPLPLPPVEDVPNKAIFEETRAILDNDSENNIAIDVDKQEPINIQADLEVIEETKRILDGLDSGLLEDNENAQQDIDLDATNPKDEQKEDNEQIIADLNADLDKLFETWDNLKSAVSDINDEDVKKVDDPVQFENVLDYEEKFGRPYRERLVLEQRNNDYENIEDSNLSEIFAAISKSAEDLPPNDTNEVLEKLASIDEPIQTQFANPPNEYLNMEPNPDDDISEENLKDNPILYGNDALVADDDNKEDEESLISEQVETQNTVVKETDNNSVKKMQVSDLSSTELDQLMKQFAILHSEDLDTEADDFDKNVAPVHMTLSVVEPLVITSPNYPESYPTNNIVDWIFDGEGTGIEFNITDFDVNGAIGDYLLVKPGGIDDSGNEGLVFSYFLRSERRYRFLDVDRLFVRFEAKPGFTDNKGFSFSVKMIAPLPEEPEPEPEPEPVLPPPVNTFTVNLGGVTLAEFAKVKEEFRQLVADMATVYINVNDVDPGLNETSKITQITRAAVCNINWPGYETCSQVTFSVPLVHETGSEESRLNEEDLDNMWNTYIYQDPFAARLMRLGITEFSSPNDGAILLVWLVIAGGVVISIAMLAFALWRFSCFDNYTRMPDFSDSDSVHEKRHLDLYPTPHQTLPPLYDGDDAKFDDTTRVDMGGYANNSFARDGLYDSDEEVVAPRDRTSSITPRDIYQV